MELIDKGFAQKIAGRYTNLKLFSINFAPIISTKRFIPRMKWLELVYALPYLVLRREILNSFKRTKNVFASAKQIWNIFLQLDYPRSRYEYTTTRLDRFSREIMKMQDLGSKIQVKHLADIMYLVSSPYVNHVKSRGFYFKSAASYNYPASYILLRISDLITHPFRHYSIKPAFFLDHKTDPVKQRGVSLDLQKSDAHYGHLETLQKGQKITSYFKSSSMELVPPVSRETTGLETEKEPAVKNRNYQLPLVTHQPPIVSHKLSAVSNKNPDPYTLSSTSDLITPLFRYYSTEKIKADMGEKAIYDSLPYFNFMNKQSHLNTSDVEKAPIYQTYPEIEHVASTHTEVMKEKVIEKGEESKPPHATPQLPSIDVNRLADQVYSFIERKLRIEKERRGLYG